MTLFHLSGLFSVCTHGFYYLIFRGKKKQVAAGHWPSPDQGEHLKSRARYNTAELSDFNEKSGPAGLVFLGHILSAIPQEIIQPSPTAKKQMVYWRKKNKKKTNTLKCMCWWKANLSTQRPKMTQIRKVLFPQKNGLSEIFIFLSPFKTKNSTHHWLAYSTGRSVWLFRTG